MAFKFPQVIYAQNSSWNLIYDPNSPNTLKPDLQNAKLQNVFGQWVRVSDGAGGSNSYFMCVVDLIFPAVNTASYRKPAQYVRAFSLSPQEVDPNIQPPDGMAMYTKELEPPVNIAQEFLNAVLDRSMAQQQASQPKSDWTQMLPNTESQDNQQISQPNIHLIGGVDNESNTSS